MRLGDLVELWGDPIAADPIDPGMPLASVCTDTRRLQPGCLFVPLVGERFDGHGYLDGALRKNALAALAQRDRLGPEEAASLSRATGRPLWLVGDSLEAYQQLALAWRRRLRVPVVAVTGSAGKTTTRELIRSALTPLGPVLASTGNENNDVGVPLTVLKATAEHRAVVLEMGMRGLGEIERLSRCAEPDVTVITNIGTAHIGRLGSREAIATAKCEITSALRPGGLLVIPAGDSLLEAAVARVWAGRVVRVGLEGDPDPGSTPQRDRHLPAPDLLGRLGPGGSAAAGAELELKGTWGSERVRLPLAGRHNARNLLLALAVARELGVDPARLRQLTAEVPGGRSRRLSLGGFTVLDETYNASPEAVLAALELLAAEPAGHRYAVLGTMLELGEQSVELHRQVAQRAAELGLDGLVLVVGPAEGSAMASAAAALERLALVETPELAAEPLRRWLERGDVVLLKGSRGLALERLLPLLDAFML